MFCPLPAANAIHAVPVPATPYGGTSGWSGSDTSRERAETEDTDGTTSARQQTVLRHLGFVGSVGATWREVAAATGWHHGQASGALSVLHKEGRIARLTVRRDRCQVYVLPSCVNGRETVDHGRDRLTPEEREALDSVESDVDNGLGIPDLNDLRLVLAALRRLAG